MVVMDSGVAKVNIYMYLHALAFNNGHGDNSKQSVNLTFQSIAIADYLPSVATEESGLANHLPSGR